ncbi:hypothetical protein JNB88_24385 [Rhizobium cauense]|uniref:YfjD family protein n=1 Tax=Rhizobium cauense TaxID=1166683 RepID=UPI001C6F4DB7|nr:YfjD family protein [Rhizobium cauense]MBW9116775.1 hypothetical protein [Rhizobium cauense]
MNYIWLFVVSGGAAILGIALAFGMIKQDGKRSVAAIGGAFVVAGVSLVLAIYTSSRPTAPIVAPDRQHSEQDRPAAPSTPEHLPGR